MYTFTGWGLGRVKRSTALWHPMPVAPASSAKGHLAALAILGRGPRLGTKVQPLYPPRLGPLLHAALAVGPLGLACRSHSAHSRVLAMQPVCGGGAQTVAILASVNQLHNHVPTARCIARKRPRTESHWRGGSPQSTTATSTRRCLAPSRQQRLPRRWRGSTCRGRSTRGLLCTPSTWPRLGRLRMRWE